MRRVFGVCLCLSTFAGSTTSVWATDLALPPPLPPPDIVAYRWSGCHAGANGGYAWSRQQQTWSRSANAAAAPVPAVLQPAAPPAGNAGNAPPANPPAANPPVVAKPVPTPPNTPNTGGGKPPYKPPVYGQHGDKGWWQPSNHDHGGKDHDGWQYGHKHGKPDRDDGHYWPQWGTKDGGSKYADHDWGWHAPSTKDSNYSSKDSNYKDDRHAGEGWSQLHSSGYADRLAWLRHDDHERPGYGWSSQPAADKHEAELWKSHGGKDNWGKDNWGKDNWFKNDWAKHDGKHDHGGYAWKPVPPHKPGWPPKTPPANNNAGQPPQQPPVQGNNNQGNNNQGNNQANNGGATPQNPAPVAGAVAPLPQAALLQTPANVASNGGDVIGGVQLGCDYQIDRFVLGIQAMADLGIINASTAVAPQLTLNARTSNLYTATVRAGYLVTPEVLLYARGGAAWTRTSVTAVNAANGQSASAAFNRSGWTVGAGVEWMFARNWSAFSEYDYADFGTVTGRLPGAAAVTGGPDVVSLNTKIHTALVGVNYRFEMLARAGR